MSTTNTFSCRSCHGQLVYEGSVDDEVVCPHCNNQVRLEEVQSPKAPPESKPSSEVRQNRGGLKNRTSSLTLTKRPPQEEEPDTAPLPPPAPPGSASLGNHRRNPGARPGNSGVGAWLIVGICLPLAFLFMVLLTHLGFWAVKDTEAYVWIGVLLIFILAFVAFGSSNVPSSLQDSVHWFLLLGASVAVLGGYYTGKAKGAKQTAYSSPFDVVERFFMNRETADTLDYIKAFKTLNHEQIEKEALDEMLSQANDEKHHTDFGRKYLAFIESSKTIAPQTEQLKAIHKKVISAYEAQWASLAVVNTLKLPLRQMINEVQQLEARMENLPTNSFAYRNIAAQHTEKEKMLSSALAAFKIERKKAEEYQRVVAQRVTSAGEEIKQYIAKQLANR